MKNLYLLPCLLIAAAAFTACKKDDKETPPKSKSDLITARTYRLTDTEMAAGKSTVTTFAGQRPCTKDDVLRFAANGAFFRTDGPLACTPPTEVAGNWTFFNKENSLRITSGSTVVYQGRIVQLDERILKLNDSTAVVNGVEVQYNSVYTTY